MSIYVARSPYRTSFNKPRLKISFPEFGGLFKHRAYRRARPHLEAAPRAISRDVSSSMINNIKTRTLKMEFGPNAVIITLMMTAVLLSLLYLMHFNRVATKGYDLNRLDASRQQLLGQYDVKNMKLAEIKSLNNMIQSGKLEGMRRPANVMYVNGGTTAYASLNFN